MFSIMTIASSTTKPVEIVSAIIDRLSSENPARYITANVPTMDSGTEKLGMIVAGRLRRNTKITMTTRATASSSSNCTSATEARTVTVRSVSVLTCTPPGKVDVSEGSNALMRSTTSITFAPGWRWMFMMIAGLVSFHAARRSFSAPSAIVATSRKRTGAPLRYAMIKSLYAAADLSWSFASIVYDCVGPSKLPLAPLTLALPIALRRSSRLKP